MKSFSFAIATLLFVVPSFSFAQSNDIGSFQVLLYDIIVALGGMFFVIAIAFFVWGGVRFIANANDPTEREKGKKFLVWAIISMLILSSIWGIVRIILVDTLGYTPGGAPEFVDKNGAVVY